MVQPVGSLFSRSAVDLSLYSIALSAPLEELDHDPASGTNSHAGEGPFAKGHKGNSALHGLLDQECRVIGLN